MLKFVRVVNKGSEPQAFDWNSKTYVLQPHPSHNAGQWVPRDVIVRGEPKVDPRTGGVGSVPVYYTPARVERQWEKVSDAAGGHLDMWPEDMVLVMRQTKNLDPSTRNSVRDLEFDSASADDFLAAANARREADKEFALKMAEKDAELAAKTAELARLRAAIEVAESGKLVSQAKAEVQASSMKPPK